MGEYKKRFIGVEYASAAFRRYLRDLKAAMQNKDILTMRDIRELAYADSDVSADELSVLMSYFSGALPRATARKVKARRPQGW